MDPRLYRGAQDGNWDVIKQFESQLYTQETSEKNTVLHILAQFCDSTFAAQQILAMTPNLLLKSNAQGETSLHIAARKGHSNVVRILIDCAKHSGKEYWPSILRIRSSNGNLALHEAVKYNRHDNIWILFQEDPTLIHISNNAKESPLYLAVEKGYRVVASLMFSSFDPVFNYSFNNDARGWTPLHYAARINHQEMARKLLVTDRSMAYVKSKSNGDGGKTALHIAITHGYIQTIEEILSYCPDCWEMLTDQGKNLIHLAVENEQKDALDFILEKSWASNLINQKDTDGNTSLHLYAATKTLPGNNLLHHPEADWSAFNNAGLTPLDLRRDAVHLDGERKNLIEVVDENFGSAREVESVISTGKDSEIPETDQRESQEESFEFDTIFHTHMLVATLILTISFAAAFTIPGGYDNKNGQPVLLRKPAFKAFIVCDALSVMFSMLAVLVLLLVPAGRTHLLQENTGVCFAYAILALLIAFVTGLYASIPIQGFRILLIVLLPLLCALLFYYFCVIDLDSGDDNVSTTSKPGNDDDKR